VLPFKCKKDTYPTRDTKTSMTILNLKEARNEKIPVHAIKCYHTILCAIADSVKVTGVSSDAINKLYSLISLVMAKLAISSAHAGFDVDMGKLTELIVKDADTEMEKFLTTNDYKIYFE
jgi:hypothetical protein